MKRILLTLWVILLIAGCQSREVNGETIFADGGSYKNVSPKELNSMLNEEDVILVNVHIPFAGNIPNTDLSIPYNQLEQNLTQLPADKSAKIVLYCRSGHMSQIASEELVSLGYTNVFNLKGGMVDWEKEGFELQE